MTEVLGPIIMAVASLLIYYVVPNDNKRYITYMDARAGATEARFLAGMVYVLFDALLETATFAGLVVFMRRVVGIDPMRVGWFIVRRNTAYFFWIHICLCIVFLACFLRHIGCDSSFAFAWLRSGFEYGPGIVVDPNVTEALLWS